MYHYKNEGISSSDETIIAKREENIIPDDYQFTRLIYPDIYIPNRSAAWHYHYLPNDSEEIIALRAAVDNYNQYLDYLDSVGGFREYFIKHNLCVSKEEITKHWTKEVADIVFSKRSYIFSTDLRLCDGFLIDKAYPKSYSVRICGEELQLPIGEPSYSYPEHARGKRLIWNWVDNGHDFTISLWELLGAPIWESEDSDDDDAPVIYGFDCYDQIRDEEPELQLVRIYNKLENLGYIKTVTIVPENPDPIWKNYCKTDGSLDCGIVDMSFLKNKLIMEQIAQLLWTPTNELKEKPYFITTEQNTQLLSSAPGALGGHKKLKIYGKLDCPSAARYLAKGQYAQHRVFFSDEDTAISAGYRPCGVCMPEAYKKWKAENKK